MIEAVLGAAIYLAALTGCTAAPTPGMPTPTPTATPVPTPSPTPQPQLLPGESPRIAFQSACAQNVLACESTQPTPNIDVEPGEGQFVTFGEMKIVITGDSPNGIETIQLLGSGSIPGTGATAVTYSWSFGATDADPDAFTPGTEFSTAADPLVRMAEGFHYIRLIVRNGQEPAFINWSPDDLQTDFLEVEIEIRRSPGGPFG